MVAVQFFNPIDRGTAQRRIPALKAGDQVDGRL
jgi:hypothetical protein